MRDLIKTRFELQKKSIRLKELKFDLGITRDKVTDLVNQQKEVDKRLKFYDEYIKIGGRINEQKIHTKER